MAKSFWDDPGLRQGEFDALVKSPGAWLLSAAALKAAADQISCRYALAGIEQPYGIWNVYRMLIGMSLESLLKGIMAAQGINVVDSNGRLANAFKTHNLRDLASKIDLKHILFSPDEIRILQETTPYIEWGGRYPIPTTSAKLTGKWHSSIDMEIELQLYERLYEHLANIGWIMRAGKRLYLRPKAT